jgi:chemotaxis protein MotB
MRARDPQLPEDDEDDDSRGWIVTFADLMALLLTFFVLLVSLSEIDVQKYRELVVELTDAFSTRPPLPVTRVEPPAALLEPKPPPDPETRVEPRVEQRDDGRLVRENYELALRELAAEIDADQLEVERDANRIVLRIREEGVFRSGSEQIDERYLPTIERIGEVVQRMRGQVQVAGHTDDRPIASARFRSNWELSAARAVTVAHHLMDRDGAEPARFEVTGFADTRPLVANDSDPARARNRRVEIVVTRDVSP